MKNYKAEIKRLFDEAKSEYESLGGWKSLNSGEWLWELIQRYFAAYWENADVEYFKNKYNTNDAKIISEKLISVAAKNAALLGGVAGAAITSDELLAIATVGEGGVGLPANIAIALTAVGGEIILMMRLQLQLIANLGKLYNIPLNPDDPEDILTIIAFALGGSTAQMAGDLGMRVGSALAGRAAKSIFKKETLAALKRIAAKVGIKILQKTIVNYTIPLASIGIGAGWNYATTKSIAKIATNHFKSRLSEIG